MAINDFGKIGVLMGGESSEREISLLSGGAIYSALRNAGYDVLKIDVQTEGLRARLEREGLDMAFIALHGKGGEDGEIQSVLEEIGIPYVGSGPFASKLALDKDRSKRLFMENSIPTPRFEVITEKDWREKVNNLRFPLFMKPISEGSSIDVVLVEDMDELKEALTKAFNKYRELIIENGIQGREITVGILGDQALPVIELRPKRKFYDFEAKYTKGLTEYLIPAQIDKDAYAKAQKLALEAHNVLGLRDFSRVDMFLDRENRPYVLEVNTIPGFTETSLLPKAANYAGIDFGELCIRILKFAKERHENEIKKQEQPQKQ